MHLDPRLLIQRRTFLGHTARGIGSLALASLLNPVSARAADESGRWPGIVNPLHRPRKAKRVIFLCMAGGPSHLETLDPKPELTRLHGQPMPDSFTAGMPIAQLQGKVDSLAADGLPFYVIPDVQTADYAEEDSLTRGARFMSRLRLANPWLVAHSLDSTVRHLRARKSPAELALLRKAVEISVRAHGEAMKATAPGCGEYEIQALLEGTFRRFGGDRPGYGSIVGSGTVSNKLNGGPGKPVSQGGAGYACIAEQRTVEQLTSGAPATGFLKPGDVVRIEMKDGKGHSIFGAIEQTVEER